MGCGSMVATVMATVPPLPPPSEGLLLGRTLMRSAWRDLVLSLPGRDAGQLLRWHEPLLADCPMDEPALLEALGHWLRPRGRQLVVVAQDFEGFARHYPRFTQWRRAWTHGIQALQPEQAAPVTSVPLWLDAQRALEWLEPSLWRARMVSSPQRLQTMHAEYDVLMQQCVHAWPANTLGL